jgi:hypothetical protein
VRRWRGNLLLPRGSVGHQRRWNGSAAALCRRHECSYALCNDADERPANTQEEPTEDEVGEDLSDEYSDDEDAGLSCRVPGQYTVQSFALTCA